MMEGLDLPAPVIEASLVGSTAIYGSGADIDYVVLVDDYEQWIAVAKEAGWVADGKYPGEDFSALRRGCFNLIVTQHKYFYDAHVLATEVMGILKEAAPQHHKSRRVELYELIRKWGLHDSRS